MKPSGQSSLKVIGVLLTSRNIGTALLALVFLILLHWAATSSHELFRHWLFSLGIESTDWWLLLPVALMLAGLYILSEKAALGKLDISNDKKTNPTRVLVVFLSYLKVDDLADEFAEVLKTGNAKDPEIRKALGTTNKWRMPLEAVVYHLPTLEKLIIITSNASSAQLGQFKGPVQIAADTILTEAGETRKLDIVSIENFGEEFKSGIDFESANELEHALNTIYDRLTQKEFRETDVLVDITGGTKLVGAIGAAVTLSKSRQFQYVTNTYEIKTYNVTHHLDPEHEG